MASAGKVMVLGFRKIEIEKNLKEAEVIKEAFDMLQDRLDEFEKSDVAKEVYEKYSELVVELKENLIEAEAEWIEAGEEYKREKSKGL